MGGCAYETDVVADFLHFLVEILFTFSALNRYSFDQDPPDQKICLEKVHGSL